MAIASSSSVMPSATSRSSSATISRPTSPACSGIEPAYTDQAPASAYADVAEYTL